jgi:hypothetical protein
MSLEGAVCLAMVYPLASVLAMLSGVLGRSLAPLARHRGLEARLSAVLQSKIDTSMPYHAFAAQLFRTAADPGSPLSPWSPESGLVRREATALLARAVEGSDAKVAGAFAAELPGLLWLYLLVVRLIRLASPPVLEPLVRAALRLARELSQPPTGGQGL